MEVSGRHNKYGDDSSPHKTTTLSSSLVATESEGEAWGSLGSPFDFRQEKWYLEVGLVISLYLSVLLSSPYPSFPSSRDLCLPQKHPVVLTTPAE